MISSKSATGEERPALFKGNRATAAHTGKPKGNDHCPVTAAKGESSINLHVLAVRFGKVDNFSHHCALESPKLPPGRFQLPRLAFPPRLKDAGPRKRTTGLGCLRHDTLGRRLSHRHEVWSPWHLCLGAGRRSAQQLRAAVGRAGAAVAYGNPLPYGCGRRSSISF